MNTLHQNKAEATKMFPSHATLIREFFKTDKASEVIESLNTNIETILFSESCRTITTEMRVHIANQLRVATLISKLQDSIEK